MYLILTASKDAYVTNKVVSNKFRATDANVGRASTIDIFKLYNESTFIGNKPGSPSRIVATATSGVVVNAPNAETLTFIIPSSYATDAGVTAGTYTIQLYSGADWAGQSASSNQVLVNTNQQAFTNQAVRDLIIKAITGTVDDAGNVKFDASTTASGIPGIIAIPGSAATYADVITLSDTSNGNLITMQASGAALSPTLSAQSFTGGLTGISNTRITGSVVELSRGLLKFDYSKIRSLMTSSIDVTHPSFVCKLRLFDISAGQVVPENFTLMVSPLTSEFDEGEGSDVISFSDLGSTNFITSSASSNSVSTWFVSGANASGSSGVFYGNTGRNSSVDFYERGFTKGPDNPETSLVFSQKFITGKEDLSIDITPIVSASLVGVLPNHGIRLSFTSSEEIDDKTRFVKRFGSRHLTDFEKVPRIEIFYDDTIQDNHRNFFFDLSGSIFMQNYHRGAPSDIMSSSQPHPAGGHLYTPLGGTDCMLVTLRTGSFITQSFVSQHTASSLSVGKSGLYSASFCIPFNTGGLVYSGTGWSGDTIYDFAYKSGSIIFEEYWSSLDGTLGFYTGSLEIKRIYRDSFNTTSRDLQMVITNAKGTYRKNEDVRFRVFVNDLNAQPKALRVPYQKKSIVLEESYYRITNIDTGAIVVPFDELYNSTRLSSDSDGLFFDFSMQSLELGSSYTIDFLIKDRGTTIVTKGKNVRFKVVS